MKRVTYDGNFCDISMCTGFNCSRPCDQRKSWERLKAIEDILGDDYDLDRLREAVEKQAEYEQFMEKWKQVAEIAGAVKKVGAERAAELVEADREGRCVVLPIVEERSMKSMADGLQDVFNEWAYEDASVGLVGMSDGEKELAQAILAALKGDQHG